MHIGPACVIIYLGMFPRNPVPYSRGRICIFSLMHIKVWQTHLMTCTLLRLSHRTSRAHRLRPEHAHCLPVGTKDEEARPLFVFVFISNHLIYHLLLETMYDVRGSSGGEPFGARMLCFLLGVNCSAPGICSSTGLSIMMSFNRVREENCVALFTKEPKVLFSSVCPLYGQQHCFLEL